ncbi:MAG: stage II sporulation protein E [Candidatus Viridilinea halotolerans]|uniref:Stage II sporulation protein E n=1 Tax=Candidatus Viridilinea halotolerans TaxID=2491704 RepID=A0A426U229_9CHLR|nr:MAG: stage II sporulation protein E [Candidatus Viridilinea halotolerans]
MGVSWGAVVRPKHGQSVSGDVYLVEPFAPHGLQVAVIDGLGGGTEAALASNGAAAVIRANLTAEPTLLMKQAHTALHGTRGAVLGLLTFDLAQRNVTYVGVGNIGAQVYSSIAIKPISKNGIIGYRLPTLLKLNYSYNFGDTFVLYSDGISSRFSLDNQISTTMAPQSLAELILQQHGKHSDDATVVVVRITE